MTDSGQQFNETTETGSGQTLDIYEYAAGGDGDPNADDGATKYSSSIAGTQLVNELSVSSTGSKTADLGVTADADIQGNLVSPGWFSIGFAPGAGMGVNEEITTEAIESSGTDPATLTVVYTEPAAGGTVPLRTLMGVGV